MTKMSNIRTYSELIELPTFKDRYKYLRIGGSVGDIRDYVIVRDHGCDLGLEGHEIYGKIIVHHMNPILKTDILGRSKFLLDPEYLISTTKRTHDAIHYGDDSLLLDAPIERTKNDTCPWRH